MNTALALALVGASAAAANDVSCDLAIVGAGPGGVYLAARAALDDPTEPDVCVFERNSRVGGRIHSLRNQGPKSDLVVEAGAYRFVLNKTCMDIEGYDWCLNTPLTRGIVRDYLKLNWTRYNPDPAAWDHKLAKITTADGADAGFKTFVEDLADRANATGRFRLFFGAEVTGVDATSDGFAIRLADGGAASATKVALNLPQQPLLRVLAGSSGLADVEEDVPDVLHSMISFPLLKLYVHYEDAWWRNTLSLTNGTFNNSDAWHYDDPNPMAADDCLASRQLPFIIQGSYHDADVRCDGDNGQCRGYIQAAYMGDVQSVREYQQFHFATNGDSVAHLDGSKAADARLLRRVHEALVQFHKEALDAAGATAQVEALRPDSGILSIWDQRADGFENACHKPKAQGLNGEGIDPVDIPPTALQPFAKVPNLFLANEAYGTLECFAEGSLVMSENIAHTHLGIPAPTWIDPYTYATEVLFNTSRAARSPTGKATLPPAKGAGHPRGDLAWIAANAR